MVTANWVTNESGYTVSNTSFFSFSTEDIHGEKISPFSCSFKPSETEIGKLISDPVYSMVVNFALKDLDNNFVLSKKVKYGKVNRYKCVILNNIEYREKSGQVFTRKI
jgi:hypothetical protein